MEGLELLDKLIAIDQSPIGRTPRSNPGTYIKVFDDIRDLFTQLLKPNVADINQVVSVSMWQEDDARLAKGLVPLSSIWTSSPMYG